MNLIVGLGNPGEKYASTRHNIGFMVIDQVLKDLVESGKTFALDKDVNSLIFKRGDLVFAKPQTFMNGSGVAVRKITNFYKIEPQHVWVIHDDIDLPLGKIRVKVGGGSAGHHGIESIMRETGNDKFVRFRLGVGKGQFDEEKSAKHNLKRHLVEKYVVSRFESKEAGTLRKLIKTAARAVETALHKGIDKAMNAYN